MPNKNRPKLLIAPIPIDNQRWSALSEAQMRKAALAAFRHLRKLEIYSQNSELRTPITNVRRELADFIVEFLPELVQNYEVSMTLES